MLIVCPNCATSYDVDVASLRPDGRRVRCVRCRAVWHAELPRREKLLAAAEALAPAGKAVEAVAKAGVDAPVPEPLAQEPEVIAGADPGPTAKQSVSDGPADAPSSDLAEEEASVAVASDTPVEIESPPIAPDAIEADRPAAEDNSTALLAASSEPPEDVETVAARRYPQQGQRRRLRWPLSQLQSIILALIVADAIVVGWRADFVRAMPQMASFYAFLGLPVNLRGLEFEDLATATEQHEGVPILVIGGHVVNVTGKTEIVPHLRFAVRNAARQEIYSWNVVPPRTALPPGQALAFRTRLASPPPDAHDVLVRFVNRYDILTGTR